MHVGALVEPAPILELLAIVGVEGVGSETDRYSRGATGSGASPRTPPRACTRGERAGAETRGTRTRTRSGGGPGAAASGRSTAPMRGEPVRRRTLRHTPACKQESD